MQNARRSLTTTETAKEIRKALKRSFPKTKFSVRSDSYAGGSSINVFWTDGPTGDAVDAVAGGFAGGGFDGTIDLKYYAESWLCEHEATPARFYGHSYDSVNSAVFAPHCEAAELVSFGADYVFSNRSYSPEFRSFVEKLVEERWGGPFDGNRYLENGRFMSDAFYRKAQEVTAEGGEFRVAEEASR